MKTLILVIFLSFNLFANSQNCCLASIWDSLKSVPISQWRSSSLAITTNDTITFKREQDSLKNSVRDSAVFWRVSYIPCDTFQFQIEFYYPQHSIRRYEIISYRFYYRKISPTSYTITTGKIHSITGLNTIISETIDTVNNYCSLPAIEKSKHYNTEKVLKIMVYNIQGQFIGNFSNTNKFSKLRGFYIFKYVTDKRTYFSKRIFN